VFIERTQRLTSDLRCPCIGTTCLHRLTCSRILVVAWLSLVEGILQSRQCTIDSGPAFSYNLCKLHTLCCSWTTLIELALPVDVMPAREGSRLPVVELPGHVGRSTLTEAIASTAPVLFVVLLFLALGLARLFSRGRSRARRSVRWFFRYWQSFFGMNYNPSSKTNLRKRHSRSPER
jgi:hypothetical protein